MPSDSDNYFLCGGTILTIFKGGLCFFSDFSFEGSFEGLKVFLAVTVAVNRFLLGYHGF